MSASTADPCYSRGPLPANAKFLRDRCQTRSPVPEPWLLIRIPEPACRLEPGLMSNVNLQSASSFLMTLGFSLWFSITLRWVSANATILGRPQDLASVSQNHAGVDALAVI